MTTQSFNARVTVTLKTGVLDPQGQAIEGSLKSLNFEGVEKIRQGKIFDVKLQSISKEEAEKTVAEMCEKLLANTVIENYHVEIA